MAGLIKLNGGTISLDGERITRPGPQRRAGDVGQGGRHARGPQRRQLVDGHGEAVGGQHALEGLFL